MKNYEDMSHEDLVKEFRFRDKTAKEQEIEIVSRRLRGEFPEVSDLHTVIYGVRVQDLEKDDIIRAFAVISNELRKRPLSIGSALI